MGDGKVRRMVNCLNGISIGINKGISTAGTPIGQQVTVGSAHPTWCMRIYRDREIAPTGGSRVRVLWVAAQRSVSAIFRIESNGTGELFHNYIRAGSRVGGGVGAR